MNNTQPILIRHLSILLAFLWRDILNETSYRLSFFLQLLGILPAVLMFFFLSRLVENGVSIPLKPYGGSYFPFVLIGIAVQNYLFVALNSFSAGLRESQLSGTLEAVLAAPVELPAFLVGSTAYSFVLNSLRILVYLAVGSLLFKVKLDWCQFPLVLTALTLTIAAFSSLGVFSASFIMLFKKGDPLNWGFNVISWLLGGVYYPLSILPVWLQKVAFFVPMTHSLEALRLSLIGDPASYEIGGHLLALGLWAGIGLPLSLVLFRYAVDRARMMGTLGHY
ncbi:MAG: ABC transporter permease [Thermodesulfobacteriota bacterium]|nr:ABC transporter permease [Thermodesulfobacteriota bacterium]